MCRDVEHVHHSGGWIGTPKWIDGGQLVAHDLSEGCKSEPLLVRVPADEGWEEWAES